MTGTQQKDQNIGVNEAGATKLAGQGVDRGDSSRRLTVVGEGGDGGIGRVRVVWEAAESMGDNHWIYLEEIFLAGRVDNLVGSEKETVGEKAAPAVGVDVT